MVYFKQTLAFLNKYAIINKIEWEVWRNGTYTE